MKVDEIMTPRAVSCRRDTSLRDVARLMCDNDCGAIPVLDASGFAVGVVTDRDIVCRTVAQGRDALRTTAGECMSGEAITVGPDASVDEARRVLEKNQIRRLIVADHTGRCVGMLSQADIARRASPADTGQLVREVSKQSHPVATTH